MKEIMFKACVRCGGDLHLVADIYGDYQQCLQCGHIVEAAEMAVAVAEQERSKTSRKEVAA